MFLYVHVHKHLEARGDPPSSVLVLTYCFKFCKQFYSLNLQLTNSPGIWLSLSPTVTSSPRLMVHVFTASPSFHVDSVYPGLQPCAINTLLTEPSKQA